MLAECKKALRVTADEYDSELVALMKAGAEDLRIAGVTLSGDVNSYTDPTTGELIDTSTLTDDLAIRAIFTYTAMMFGNPPNYDKLKESYETQKVQLMHASGYTDWGEDG